MIGLAGCTTGPDPLTLVEGVELVAAVAEPPEVAPGEPFEVTVTVGDPLGEGVDAAIWWCPPDDGPCASARPEVVDGVARATLTATAPTPVWVVACARDLGCDPREVDLRDPYAWLQRLPLEGVAAGTRAVTLTELPPGERRANPTIVEAPALGEVDPEEEVELTFLAAGATRASGLTTGGGFDAPSSEVSAEGEVTLTWFAPAEAGEVTLWVVLDDELGGAVVWTATTTVR